jgi:SAM-dependent methyltransferase
MFSFKKKTPAPLYCLDCTNSGTTPWDPMGFKIEGWIGETIENRLMRVEWWAGDRIAGATDALFERTDVAPALGTDGLYKGFAMFARAPWVFGQGHSPCKLIAVFETGPTELLSREARWISKDYQSIDYGSLLSEKNNVLHHRGDIYSSGPSVPGASPECLQLVRRYLGQPPINILDVGCGIGAYGKPLLAQGYDWIGVEVKTSDCVALEKMGLPHRQVDGHTLPFSDGSFDCAISVEVLEHIADPKPFLKEIRRVTRRRVLISVPNIEILPYMRPLLAVPWHLLEADHKNFFTRTSLQGLLLSAGFRKVEVIPYGVHPLKSIEGFPLYYHLLAISDI